MALLNDPLKIEYHCLHQFFSGREASPQRASLRKLCLFYPLFLLFLWKWEVGGQGPPIPLAYIISYHISSGLFFRSLIAGPGFDSTSSSIIVTCFVSNQWSILQQLVQIENMKQSLITSICLHPVSEFSISLGIEKDRNFENKKVCLTPKCNIPHCI